MTGHTIIAAPFDAAASLKALVHGVDDFDELALDQYSHRLFKIKRAHSGSYSDSAGLLINRMYSWRGYHGATLGEDPTGNRITLVASEGEETLGTISVGFDHAQRKLLVDQFFPEEVDDLRRAGYRLCEFTKLAVDGSVRSKRVLATLFHVAYIYAHRIKRSEKLLIEVNPRHVRFYERMLGFTMVGPERINPRVNAPAVLMCLDFSHAHRQIALFGGQPELATVEKSMYPYFLSIEEEAKIVGRLMTEAAVAGHYRAPALLS